MSFIKTFIKLFITLFITLLREPQHSGLVAVLLLFFLAACGFQLRDPLREQLRDPLKDQGSSLTARPSVRLDTPGDLAALGDVFRQTFSDRGVVLVEASSAEAPSAEAPSAEVASAEGTGGRYIILRIEKEVASRRSMLTTAAMQVAEYVLQLEVRLQIQLAVDAAPETVTLATERTYSLDPNNLSGSQEEEALLLNEMRRALAGRMLGRIELLLDAPSQQE